MNVHTAGYIMITYLPRTTNHSPDPPRSTKIFIKKKEEEEEKEEERTWTQMVTYLQRSYNHSPDPPREVSQAVNTQTKVYRNQTMSVGEQCPLQPTSSHSPHPRDVDPRVRASARMNADAWYARIYLYTVTYCSELQASKQSRSQ